MRPIFVVGCDRSGTTLLGAMIGGHPNSVCLPEATFIKSSMPEGPAETPVQHSEILSRIEMMWRFRIWNFDLNGRRPKPGDSVKTYADTWNWLVLQYAEECGRSDPEIWIEHWPGKILYLARLLDHFPDAKVIHIIRDGRAVAASFLSLDWGPNTVREAAFYWTRIMGFGFSASACFGPEKIYNVHYEDLVTNSEQTMREICKFIGIDFHSDMLNSKGLKVPKFTQKQHSLVGEQPKQSRVTAWRESLSPREIEIFESLTHDLLRYLGYELDNGPHPKPLTIFERLRMTPHRVFHWLINNIFFLWRSLRYRKENF